MKRYRVTRVYVVESQNQRTVHELLENWLAAGLDILSEDDEPVRLEWESIRPEAEDEPTPTDWLVPKIADPDEAKP